MVRYLLPLGVLLALIVLLGVGLTLNPRLVPSPLVGKSAPEFSLPRLDDPTARLSRSDLLGQVSLLNVWATWCAGCRDEHPLLVEIARDGRTPIYGLNYKDQFRPAQDWLRRHGNPYVASAYDAEGKVGLDLGVYGLPETFVIAADGTIAHRHVGPLTRKAWEEQLLPLLARLRAEATGS